MSQAHPLLLDYATMVEWLARNHPRALTACVSEKKREPYEMLACFRVGSKVVSIPRLTVAYNKYRRLDGLEA